MDFSHGASADDRNLSQNLVVDRFASSCTQDGSGFGGSADDKNRRDRWQLLAEESPCEDRTIAFLRKMQQNQVPNTSSRGEGTYRIDRLGVRQVATTAHDALLQEVWSWRVALHFFVVVALD